MSEDFQYPYLPCSLCYQEEHEDKVIRIEGNDRDWTITICRKCKKKVKNLKNPRKDSKKMTRKWKKLTDGQREKVFEVINND